MPTLGRPNGYPAGLARLAASRQRRLKHLRFFKEQSLGEVAAAMRASESAAQSRVHRAVEKMRRFLLSRGLLLTTTAIAAALAADSVQAAPAQLAGSVTAIAIGKGAAASGSTLLLQRVMQQAQALKLAPGGKLRVDTTAVETNIHYPTDSSLLADSLRVMTRALKRIAVGCAGSSLKVVDHARAAKYRVLEICRAAKSFTETSRAPLKDSYGKLLRLTRQVRGQAGKALEDLSALKLKAEAANLLSVLVAEAQLRHYLPLVDRVVAQTQARVFDGDTRHEDKILSLFEEHSAIIRNGKPDKPTEFGRLGVSLPNGPSYG